MVAFLLLLSACDDDGPTEPVIVGLEIAGGDGQVGAAGSALPEPLSVRATDERDRPVPDIWIHWTFDEESPSSAPSLGEQSGRFEFTNPAGKEKP